MVSKTKFLIRTPINNSTWFAFNIHLYLIFAFKEIIGAYKKIKGFV